MNSTRRWSVVTWHFWRWLGAVVMAGVVSGAFAQAATGSFDHLKTGFALTGTHIAQRCESCHQLGVFKGTPRDCASCHTAGTRLSRANVVRPDKHIPTQLTCDSCHNTQAFTGARFTHAGVAIGSCATCHAAGLATAKTPGHIVTSASCDSCHRTTAWRPASTFNHVGVAAGTCATCHGVTAKGKTALHIPTFVPTSMPSCDSCHRSGFTSFLPARFHASVAVSASCVTCHSGGFSRAVGKPNTPVHANVTVCESCHKSTVSWAGARVDHSGFTTQTNCASCHDGRTATAKVRNHIPVGTTNCLSCHTTTAWNPSFWNHTQITPLPACATCHTGQFLSAVGKSAGHVSTTAACDTCHKSTVSWVVAKPDHTAFSPSTNCTQSGCHGSGASGKTISHIPTGTLACTSCHSTSGWRPTLWTHAQMTPLPGCATCHNGQYPPVRGKTPTHIVTTAACETCHKTTAIWLGAKTDHTGFTAATNCATCHATGGGATARSANHIPIGTANCFSCHGTTVWAPSKWNHTQVAVAGQCATCHTGGFPPADGRSTLHAPFQLVSVTSAAKCDTCHSGFTLWTGVKLHGKVAVSAQCVTCHSAPYLLGQKKPNTAVHANVTGNCESCHRSTVSWLTVTFAHNASNAVGTGSCDTCHGVSARGKPTTHIPVPAGTAKCDSCHRSQASWATAVTMNHAVVTTATCKSCHDGRFLTQGVVGALAKPTNHIPEHLQLLNGAAMDCRACHTGTTAWTTVRMNHNASLGNGSGWCKGCHTSGQAFLGNMEKKSLNHERAGSTDCSQSGCHRPLGNRGSAYSSW